MFHGSLVALVTPMDGTGRLDLPALERLVEFHLQAGTNGIVVAGTTGESATLHADEFETMLSVVRSVVSSAVPVLAGTGGADTAKAVAQTETAARLGADAALVVTPYYNRPMQSGLLAHYHALADATSLPLVLYNVPSRTGVDMLPETVAELAEREEIVAVKEAVSGGDRVRVLKALCGDSAVILSGDDPSCLEAMRAGAEGVVSVAANVVPGRFRDMCEAASRKNWQAAVEIDRALHNLYRVLAVETNPIPVKWALHQMGLVGSGIRLPLLPLDNKHRQTMADCLDQLGLMELQKA